MPEPSARRVPWWHRRFPSLLVFAVVLTAVGLVTMAMAREVADVMPEVGKDHLGGDAWTEPLGIEVKGGVSVARLPDCAAGSVTRIVLWDPDSKPYWEVTGPPTAMAAFYVGVKPPGFSEVTPYTPPPAGTVLRLVAFRQEGEVAGIRYRTTDLRDGRVVSGNPLARYTVAGFQSARVCSDSAVTRSSVLSEAGGGATG